MSHLPVTTPVGPQSIRVFAGYRLPTLTREAFFKELGDTFMPGTPCMLAPLGLCAYVAAALDFNDGSGMPDEVALIVYASLDAYNAARQKSLQGRMYTHSHAGVFDMARSRGQFPGTLDEPNKLPTVDRWSWYLFDRPVDWQVGSTRLLFITGKPTLGTMQDSLLRATRDASAAFEAAGVDQVIGVAAVDYAAIWIHGTALQQIDPAETGLVPAGVKIARDLMAVPVPMPTGVEGVTIANPAAFSFRFVRELRYFL
jgi:hypothetical protein